jgi:hypothetical protein
MLAPSDLPVGITGLGGPGVAGAYVDGRSSQARPRAGQREVGPLGTPGPWTRQVDNIQS